MYSNMFFGSIQCAFDISRQFSLYNSRKTPHSSPVKSSMRCRSWVQIWSKFYYYTPASTKLKGGYWLHLVRPSVRLSVCGQNRACSVSSTILVGSISYLHILSSNFGKFWQICNFDFVFFWLGTQYDSIIWVIMRRRGYPQNAGVLVVLVVIVVLCALSRYLESPLHSSTSLMLQMPVLETGPHS